MDSKSFLAHLFGHWSIGTGWLRVHLDTLLITNAISLSLIYFISRASKRAKHNEYSRFYLVIDWIAEYIERVAGSLGRVELKWNSGSLYIILLLWIAASNSLSLLPTFAISSLFSQAGLHHFNLVPTTDLNFTLAMAISSICMVNFIEIKSKGFVSYLAGKSSHPLPHWVFFPINIPLSLLTEVVFRTATLSFRLFVNMVIGEIGYLGITMACPMLAAAFPNLVWSLIHLMIIPLQAYIFMVLSSVYIEVATHESH